MDKQEPEPRDTKEDHEGLALADRKSFPWRDISAHAHAFDISLCRLNLCWRIARVLYPADLQLLWTRAERRRRPRKDQQGGQPAHGGVLQGASQTRRRPGSGTVTATTTCGCAVRHGSADAGRFGSFEPSRRPGLHHLRSSASRAVERQRGTGQHPSHTTKCRRSSSGGLRPERKRSVRAIVPSALHCG